MATNPFKRHRFPPQVILLAVRWYCRYPLSYRDIPDLLSERGIHVVPATINRWMVKFGPLIATRARKLHYTRSMWWHVDETYLRVAGKWRYLWRIVDEHAALKRIVNPGKGFKTLRTAKPTLLAIEAFRTIKRDDIFEPSKTVTDELRLVNEMFSFTA